jgi:hypothetical protein
MLKFLPHLVLVLVLALLTAGCQVSALVAGTPQPNQVLFQDDFSNQLSGWARASDAGGATGYDDGMFRILVNAAGVDLWSHPGLNFGDARIEVDALRAGGGSNNRFGPLCRLTGTGEASSFYAFLVSSDGYYGISKVRGQETHLLGSQAMLPSEAIRPGSEPNHIRADCVGDRLTLYVNGLKLAEVEDAEFTQGDVGLLAGAYQDGGVDIRFDNFSVLKP